MDIESYNRELLRDRKSSIQQSETIRGSVNYDLISALKQYYHEHGYPTEIDYQRQQHKIKQFQLTLKLKQMDIGYLKKYAFEKIKKYPDKEDIILDIVNLAIDNIEDGDSEANEVSIAINDIDENTKPLTP